MRWSAGSAQSPLSVRTAGGGAAGDDAADDDEAGPFALAPMHGPPRKRQKTVLTVSASLVNGDAGGTAATHRAIAKAVGVPKSQLCTAAAAAAVQTAVHLLEGNSEQRKVESPMDVPSSVIVHASAEMEEPICVGNAQALGLPAHLGTATEASITPMVRVSAAVEAGWLIAGNPPPG